MIQKDLTDFWGSINQVLTPEIAQVLGISASDFPSWTVRSTLNVGDAKITGVEANYTRKLDFIPGWGKYFNFTTNGTSLNLTGPNGTDFRQFIERSGNIALSFNKKPVVTQVKLNYRGRQLVSPGTGTFNNYYESRFNIDVNFEYTYSKRLKIFMNARNILNEPQNTQLYSPDSAVYARLSRSEEFGIQLAAGIKGSW